MMREPDGLLVIQKPKGLTSHDVVERIRRVFGTRHVGHTGTLDPMAEGVLVVLVGRATRAQRQLQGHDKRYDVVIQFGAQTDTGDAWGQTIRTMPVPEWDRPFVEAIVTSFVGTFNQVPPAFSAVKVQGRPLYWWTRRGIAKTAPARTVTVRSIELLALPPSRLHLRLVCSAGTYIRTFAEACAERLGTVGHVCELVRLAVGPWELAQALSLEALEQLSAEERSRVLQHLETLPCQQCSSDVGP